MEGRKITVLGAGIGGLAAALALARRGARVTLLEQAGAIQEVGAGLQISPNGVAVLRALGLQQALEQRAQPGARVCLRDYRGAPVVDLDLAGARARGPYYFLHRADLIELLAKGARAAGVRLRLLQQVRHVARKGDEIILTTQQGAEHRCNLLVGADGVHSVVRRALGEAAPARFTGQVAWRALVPADGDVADRVVVHMGPGRHMVHYPLRGGRLINIVAVEERPDWAEESWNRLDDPAHLRTAFAGFCDEARALLARVEQTYLWGLFRHPVAQSWHAGSMAILGDAAHPTLPFLAQGANMALEDAWVLGAALADHAEPEQALAVYQNARRARCTRIVSAASRNARNYHLRFPPLRLAAHSALRLAGQVAPERLLGRFDWLYGHDVTAQTP